MDDEIKVSELPEASQLNDSDLVMIIQGQANKKIYAQTFNSGLNTRLTTAETDIDNLETANAYSTSETVIGKWINNKPLYRKVIDIGNLPNATSKTVSTGLTINSTHCIPIKLYGIANYTNGISLPLPFLSTASNASISLNIDNSSQIVVTTQDDRSSTSGYVVIEYIKATD